MESLESLEGFGEKKAENLIQSISEARNRSLGRLITALGIRGVGSVSAEDLSAEFHSLDGLLNARMEQSRGNSRHRTKYCIKHSGLVSKEEEPGIVGKIQSCWCLANRR